MKKYKNLKNKKKNKLKKYKLKNEGNVKCENKGNDE